MRAFLPSSASLVIGCAVDPQLSCGLLYLSFGLLTRYFFIFFLSFFWGEESLHVHRCQSCQQPERQIKQTTGELRVHSTSYDKGSCFAMA